MDIPLTKNWKQCPNTAGERPGKKNCWRGRQWGTFYEGHCRLQAEQRLDASQTTGKPAAAMRRPS